MNTAIALDHYRLLGRSGLRVSPMPLGTMTFGPDWGWGADRDEARAIFVACTDRGRQSTVPPTWTRRDARPTRRGPARTWPPRTGR
jgi:hypothetical protein